MKKTKVVIIGLKGLPAFGGAATVGEHLITHLKDQFDFTVLSTASHALKEHTEVGGIKQIVFRNYGKGGIGTLYYYIRCLIHVLLSNYDLVHLHHAESGFITPFLRLKYKVITTFHGTFHVNDPKFSPFINRFFRFSEKLNIRFSSEVVSVSKHDAEYCYNKYKRKLKVIPNGISSNLQKKDENLDYILFAAARIYGIKGLHYLLKSLKLINYTGKLVVIGDLNQREEYKKVIFDLSKSLNVEFIGLIQKKEELLKHVRNAKLFVFPSETEAMSMMLLEAVSQKTPVVASDIPGNTSIFSSKELNFFRSEDIHDLAEKIIGTLSDINSKKKAENAFERLMKDYSWETISLTYKNLYLDILKE